MRLIILIFPLILLTSCGLNSNFKKNISSPTPTKNGISIIDGEPAPRTVWAIKIGAPFGGGLCTGSALTDSYILTARHCIEGSKAEDMEIFYSTGNNNEPDYDNPVTADELLPASSGDIALIKLKTKHKLTEYPKLNFDYKNPIDHRDDGTIYGYGQRDVEIQVGSDELYMASVLLAPTNDCHDHISLEVPPTNLCKDVFCGDSIYMMYNSGIAYHGDSGGPIVTGGYVIGVISRGLTEENKTKDTLGSNLSQAKDFILDNINGHKHDYTKDIVSHCNRGISAIPPIISNSLLFLPPDEG